MSKKIVENTEKIAEQDPLAMLVHFKRGGTVEDMESQGQKQLVESETLPARCADRRPLMVAGVAFGGPVEGDPLFVYAVLPPGWTKRATKHAMHSELLDERGRVRAAIFYKAAFYDRRATLTAHPRFRVSSEYGKGDNDTYAVAVLDGGREIFRTRLVDRPKSQDDAQKRYHDEVIAVDEEARAWVAERYPQYQDAAAYWDEP